MRRRLGALATVLALAGCGSAQEPGGARGGTGGAPTGPVQDPRALYEQALRDLDQVGGGTLDAELEARLTFGATQALTLTEEGAFSGLRGTAFPDYRLEITAGESSDDGELTEVVHLGRTLFVKPAGADGFQRQTGELVERNAQVYARETRALPPGRLPLLALTPSDWVTGDLREAGREAVEGRPARRLTGTLALRPFLLDLETAKRNRFGLGLELTRDARRLLDEPASEQEQATIEALIDQEGRLRRLVVALDANAAPASGGGDPPDDLGRVEVDLRVALDELGQAQEIRAPDVPGG